MNVNKIIRMASYAIVEGPDKFCVVGTKLVVFSNSGEQLAVFSDMKNYSWAFFLNAQQLITSNTSGVFKVYSLNDENCVTTHKPLNSLMSFSGRAVVDVSNHLLYSLVSEVNTRKVCLDYVMKFKILVLDFITGEKWFVDLPDNGTATEVLRSDPVTGFHFVFNRKIPLGKTAEGQDNFTLEAVLARFQDNQIHFEEDLNINLVRCNFTSQYVIIDKHEVYWYCSGERIKLNYECLDKVIYSSNVFEKYILIASTNTLCIIDMLTNKEVFRYEEDLIRDARIISDDLYIATAYRLLKIENIVSCFVN